MIRKLAGLALLFSPPYGDGTEWCMTDTGVFMFSPPYGDGTLCLTMNLLI